MSNDFLFRRTEFENAMNVIIKLYGKDPTVTYKLSDDLSRQLEAIDQQIQSEVWPLLKPEYLALIKGEMNGIQD